MFAAVLERILGHDELTISLGAYLSPICNFG